MTETKQMIVETDQLIAEANQMAVEMNAVVEAIQPREDATVPNMEISAMLAAQDQFEAVKRGEANIAVEETVRALNQISPELDWAAIMTKIHAVVSGDIQVIDQKIVVFGPTADEAKNTSAKVWKVLAELKRSQQIRSLPAVEMKVGVRS